MVFPVLSNISSLSPSDGLDEVDEVLSPCFPECGKEVNSNACQLKKGGLKIAATGVLDICKMRNDSQHSCAVFALPFHVCDFTLLISNLSVVYQLIYNFP